MLRKRLPFSICYKVEGDVCMVWRVLDRPRQPGSLRPDISRGK